MQKNNIHEELCLDFANTLDWHASLHPQETLHDFGDIITWCQKHDTLTDEEAARLRELCERLPTEAETVYGQALMFREAVYEIIVAYIHEKEADATQLSIINDAVESAYSHLHIRPAGHMYVWDWSKKDGGLEYVLWPVIHSAASFLTTPHLLKRVGQCADDRGCGWLFLDMSKNHSRRWCDIKDCGNRAKQRRHYQRNRAG